MSAPPISVVIPAFNAERFLSDAIDSVLSQTRPPQEVIVVDDGSEDGTLSEAQKFEERVTIIQQPRLGVSAARNRGIQKAGTEFVAFLDADDIMLPNRLEFQWSRKDTDVEVDLWFGHECRFEGDVPDLPLSGEAASVPALIPSTLFCRRSIFSGDGEFKESLERDDFIEWFTRVTDEGLTWRVAEETLILRRIHDQNFSRQMATGDAYTHLVKAMLDRRRERD